MRLDASRFRLVRQLASFTKQSASSLKQFTGFISATQLCDHGLLHLDHPQNRTNVQEHSGKQSEK